MPTPSSRSWYFEGAATGAFRIVKQTALRGPDLPSASHLRVTSIPSTDTDPVFRLHGVVSNERYTTRHEKTELVAVQEAIGRSAAPHGAMIALKKSDAWWALTQDERRQIFEDRSHHVAIGLRALPAIARRLHHCRDLGTEEPFDFLTWFDFHPDHGSEFDELLGALRDTEEWTYIEREVELRVERV